MSSPFFKRTPSAPIAAQFEGGPIVGRQAAFLIWRTLGFELDAALDAFAQHGELRLAQGFELRQLFFSQVFIEFVHQSAAGAVVDFPADAKAGQVRHW